MGFARSMKKRISLDTDNDTIARYVSYNRALEDVVAFLGRLIDNKVSPESIKAYLLENEE